MKRNIMALGALSAVLLASCGQQANTQVPSAASAYQDRPELADAGSQAILARYGNDPGLLVALQTAYGERSPDQPETRSPALTGLSLGKLSLGKLSLEGDRLAYVKSVGWGSVPSYDGQYAAYAASSLPYPGLVWTRDGCSAPDGLGLGYREDFRGACNVHDFGYRNLRLYERLDANRKTTDEVFQSNMNTICAAKSWYRRPACYSAAYAYYQGVRVGGGSSF
jgi:Prokaryotic phospholipase A2